MCPEREQSNAESRATQRAEQSNAESRAEQRREQSREESRAEQRARWHPHGWTKKSKRLECISEAEKLGQVAHPSSMLNQISSRG